MISQTSRRFCGACVLMALIAGCGTTPLPGGGGNGGGLDAVVTGPRLLVKTWSKVLTFTRDSSLSGEVAPKAILAGDQTQQGTYGHVVVTASNQVITDDGEQGSRKTAAISVFADSTHCSGNQAPIRQVTGDQTQLGRTQPSAMALDVAADTLYVGVSGFENNFLVYKILVFNNVSQAVFNGNIAPARVLKDPNWGAEIVALFVRNNTLYGSVGGFLVSYANASTLASPITANTGGISSGQVQGIFVDASNRLYTVAGFGNSPTAVSRFDNASAIVYNPATQSAPTASAVFTMPAGIFPRGVTVDSAGVGYVAEEGNGADKPTGVFIFNNMATGASAAQPDRKLTWLNVAGTANPAAAIIALD